MHAHMLPLCEVRLEKTAKWRDPGLFVLELHALGMLLRMDGTALHRTEDVAETAFSWSAEMNCAIDSEGNPPGSVDVRLQGGTHTRRRLTPNSCRLVAQRTGCRSSPVPLRSHRRVILAGGFS